MKCNKTENVRIVDNLYHVFYSYPQYSLVTADIDKALLCTENAVEVALEVRGRNVML